MGDDDATPPADAFELAGNEIRATIVQELQRAYREGDRSLAYAELQSRVGLRDSGRFNYHLQQLVGRFVAKDGSEYGLTYAGRKVASAIAAGTFNEAASLSPTPVEGTCYACGETALVLSYRDEGFHVSCGACGEAVVHMPFPPGSVADRDPADLPGAVDRWARSWNALAAAGVCPECRGEMTVGLSTERGAVTVGDVEVRADLDCTRCWMRGHLPVGCLLLEHPAVAAFYWRHGHDVGARHLWEYEWALSEAYQTVRETEPYRLELRVPLDDAELRVTVDDSLAVTETTEHRDHSQG